MENFFTRIEELYPEMVELRRYFHQHPELSFQEVHTPQKIAQFLTELGIEVLELELKRIKRLYKTVQGEK